MSESAKNWKDKDFLKRYMRDYYEQHYPQQKDIYQSTVVCDCGKSVNLSSYKRHLKTSYHLKHILLKSDRDEFIRLEVERINDRNE